MGVNKNAYIRYQTLDKCFSNPYKLFFIEDLLEEVNKALEYVNGFDSIIKKRQLFDDIKFMESESGWAIPLERFKEGRRTFYRYSDINYSIKNQKITDNEIDVINSALIVLTRFRGLPQFDWINELSTKLKSHFELDDAPEIISFDHNEFLTGLDLLPSLYQSILNKAVLSIEYQAFHMEASIEYVIHPYYLKQYNKRWFLLGLNRNDNRIYTIPFDRIKKINIKKEEYIENKIINFSEYFEDIIGVSRKPEDKPIKIKLFFNAKTAPYILTKPLHGSQKKLNYDENGLIVQIEVIPNFELKQLILSYGDSIEILTPESFKKKFMKLNNYY
ncbi:helix-turn-helix transcriptional regulator [Lutibacter holmesii]|uniref:Helix-turn-helix transcriptional regulator n=1 Tax=Lutibacter holmesii TaxID=1137985 RepID=A0ABW3WN17_9FLAO